MRASMACGSRVRCCEDASLTSGGIERSGPGPLPSRPLKKSNVPDMITQRHERPPRRHEPPHAVAILMSLFEWVRARWCTTTPVPKRRAAIPVETAMPPVAPPYVALYTYLQHRYASNVVLTFEQVEALLGFALPAPARAERDWWTSPVSDMDGHSNAWTVARRSATPNLLARTVAFERLP